jgi:hypothetical protein
MFFAISLLFLPDQSQGQCTGAAPCVTNLNDYKCITTNSVSSLISQQLLLPFTAAGITPQKIILNGTLTVDQNYQFAMNTDIVMLPGSEIIVAKFLNIPNHITIRGCSGPWEDIKVVSNGRLTLNGSDISGACGGINLQAGSVATITGNQFTNNSICIQVHEATTLLGEGIAHNLFDGSLHPACTSQTAAILLDHLELITIGNPSGTGPVNDVFNYNKGIISTSTNVVIYNTIFHLSVIPPANPPVTGSIAIDLKSDNTGVYTANVFGKGATATDLVFIQNYDIGIRYYNHNLTVKNAYFQKERNGIVHIQNPLFPTQNFVISLDIENNRFEDYLSSGYTAVGRTYRTVNFIGNDFEDGNGLADDNPVVGLKWFNNTSKTCNITVNKFYDNQKPALTIFAPQPPLLYFANYGIFASNPSGMTIETNMFYQNYQAVADHDFKGIFFHGGNGINQVKNNIISANFGPSIKINPAFDSLNEYIGIDVRDAQNNGVTCNAPSNFDKGIVFRGICNKTTFANNGMSNNDIGLYLQAGAVIGQQKATHNTWAGSLPAGGVAEALFDGNPGPSDLTKSGFFIDDFNTMSINWPNPGLPSGWFKPLLGGPYPTINCLKANPVKSESDRQLIAGEFQPYKGYPASTWEATLNAYGLLADNPDVLSGESAATQQFYASHNTDNIGKLYRAMTSWAALTSFSNALDSSWDDNQASIAQVLNSLASQNALMENAQTDADQQPILQTTAALQSQLQALQTTSQGLVMQYNADVIGRANQLIADLANITTTDVWETNVKTVLTLDVQHFLSGNTDWSAAEQITLQSIANQCRFEGGIGVVMARVANGTFRYNDNAMCPGLGVPRGETAETVQSLATPNPANAFCRITFEKPFSGQLVVSNLNGQIVQSALLENALSNELDTHAWPNGLYTVLAKNTHGRRLMTKLAIIH